MSRCGTRRGSSGAERVHALARQAAHRTGQTQTSAIEVALTRLIADLDESEGADDRKRRIESMVVDMQAMVRAATVELSTHDLYDDAGFPR